MAHFAKVVNNIVTTVIVADQDWVDNLDGEWVQTSYNTRGGVHWTTQEETFTLGDQQITIEQPVPSGGVALRKNYAGVGYTYDSTRDAFYAPQPFPSWTLDEDSCLWESPTAHPNDGKSYDWDEDTTSWVEVT